MRRARVIWSPVETEYLKKHKKDPKDQLCIALSKTRSAIDKKLRELNPNSKSKAVNSTPIGRQSRVGRRADLGIFVRSGWEANMMRLFQSNQIEFTYVSYEPEVFSFTEWEKPKGMALSYTPDFLVKHKGSGDEYWVEVKGNWLRSHDKTKMRRFKKHYPAEFAKLIAVVSSMNTKTALFFKEIGIPDGQILEYNQFKKEYKDKVPYWES